MAGVTLSQIVDGKICTACAGAGIIPDPENPLRTITCSPCVGTGYGSGDRDTPVGLRKTFAILAQAIIDLQR